MFARNQAATSASTSGAVSGSGRGRERIILSESLSAAAFGAAGRRRCDGLAKTILVMVGNHSAS